MLTVSRSFREFRANDGDDTRQRITQVVDGIHHDGYTTGKDAYSRLKSSQKHIGYNTNDTSTDNLCNNITLNVWEGNDAAYRFYKNMGMQVQKTTMEIILKKN